MDRAANVSALDRVPPRRAAVADLSDAVRRAQDGDEDAFRELYRDLQPRLLRYLRALVGDDADDVASETWLHIAPRAEWLRRGL
jgi:RNA polymerase sigma-70 factor (ECF subfamily)